MTAVLEGDDSLSTRSSVGPWTTGRGRRLPRVYSAGRARRCVGLRGAGRARRPGVLPRSALATAQPWSFCVRMLARLAGWGVRGGEEASLLDHPSGFGLSTRESRVLETGKDRPDAVAGVGAQTGPVLDEGAGMEEGKIVPKAEGAGALVGEDLAAHGWRKCCPSGVVKMASRCRRRSARRGLVQRVRVIGHMATSTARRSSRGRPGGL